MKKTIKIFIMALFVSFTLCIPSFAVEDTEVIPAEDTTITENATESENKPSTEMPDSMTTEDVENYWNDFKDMITNSSIWAMIATGLVTLLGSTGIVKGGLKKVVELVMDKADNATIRVALKGTEAELKKDYNARFGEISERLKGYEESIKTTADNEQTLYAVLALFMINCKISESAKAEIIAMLTGIKKYSGNIGEIVEKAQAVIEKTKEEKIADAPATPELDKLLNEENNYMKLG